MAASPPELSPTVPPDSSHLEITETSVRAALDSLLYNLNTRERSGPLCGLRLVEQLLLAHDAPDTALSRQMALAELLTGIITEIYQHHRRVQGLAAPLPDAPLDTAFAQIAADAAVDAAAPNPELLGWGWLYYRYVRVDLALNRRQFAAAFGVEVRTLQRYARHGVRRLTERLIQREREAVVAPLPPHPRPHLRGWSMTSL